VVHHSLKESWGSGNRGTPTTTTDSAEALAATLPKRNRHPDAFETKWRLMGHLAAPCFCYPRQIVYKRSEHSTTRGIVPRVPFSWSSADDASKREQNSTNSLQEVAEGVYADVQIQLTPTPRHADRLATGLIVPTGKNLMYFHSSNCITSKMKLQPGSYVRSPLVDAPRIAPTAHATGGKLSGTGTVFWLHLLSTCSASGRRHMGGSRWHGLLCLRGETGNSCKEAAAVVAAAARRHALDEGVASRGRRPLQRPRGLQPRAHSDGYMRLTSHPLVFNTHACRQESQVTFPPNDMSFGGNVT